MKIRERLRVTHCAWQEIPFTIDLTARTVPQQALLICPLSQHLPLCWFFVAFQPGPEGGRDTSNQCPSKFTRISCGRKPLDNAAYGFAFQCLPSGSNFQHL